jgi:hypothetical protein
MQRVVLKLRFCCGHGNRMYSQSWRPSSGVIMLVGWFACFGSALHGVRLLVHDAAVTVTVTAEFLDGEEPAAEVGHAALHQEEAVAEGQVLLLQPGPTRSG